MNKSASEITLDMEICADLFIGATLKGKDFELEVGQYF